MQYIDGIENYQETGKSVVTFGKFDGLHKGHQKLIHKVMEFSEIYQLKSIVCAFDMSRKEILMTKEERKCHLEDKVDYLVRGVFTESFRHMSAEDFIRVIVKDRFHADYVIVGTDFHFGYGKMGDCKTLEFFSDSYDYKPIIINKEYFEDHVISSTLIKESLRQGDVQRANLMLGYNYSITGNVSGEKIAGDDFVFELEWPEEKIVPLEGVYFTRTTIDGIGYDGISCIGKEKTVNTRLYEYSGDAIGKSVKLELLQFHERNI